ncbi:hypothetical protein PG999_010614 [Apiospora kogelbergensis]|uniref:Uncharacterized protein n=1 Tax=Apiospora kogelbergensis TaxID=1337665 RepID=A0AAW0QAN2_9PEZI
MAHSFLRWLSKLPLWGTVNDQGKSDTAASQPLAEAVSTESPTVATGAESDLIDTPPPSYEDVCPGFVEARIGATAEGRLVLQDDRRGKIVDGVMEQVEYELQRLEQVADVDCVSSNIRRLCYFAACRVSEDYQGHSDAMIEERRQTNHTEVYKLLNLVTKSIPPSVFLAVAINMTAIAFEEIAEQFMAEKKYSNHWQVRGEFHYTRFSIYRAAVRVCENLAEDKKFPPSTVAALTNAANCYHSATVHCIVASDSCLK